MAELHGVPIWSAEKALDGREVTEQDVQDVVDSFAAIGDRLKPFVKLGHGEDQTILKREKPKDEEMPSGGWIKRLYRQGKTILADIVGVPDALYQLVNKGAYRRVSAEVFHNLKVDGKTYRRALRAVAFLGADTPAIGSLGDIVALGYASDDVPEVYESELVFTKEDFTVNKCPHCGAVLEKAGMEKCTACGKSLQIEKHSADPSGVNVNFSTVDVEAIKKAEAEKYAADLKAKDDELAAAKAEIAKFAAEKETARIDKFTAEVDALTTSGKLPPALKDEAIAIFKHLDATTVITYTANAAEVKATPAEMFSAFLAKAAKLDAFKETLPNKDGDVDPGEIPEGVDPESYALDKATEKYAADNKVEYSVARKAVLAQQKKG